jgi:uncharacterized protein YdeI (YjbR/CyaY-like superfamily)
MTNPQILAGTNHDKVPADLRKVLTTRPQTLLAWQNITPLARNEWLCWVESAKLIDTRNRRIERVYTELAEGKRRPCCWPGCIHREKNGKEAL